MKVGVISSESLVYQDKTFKKCNIELINIKSINQLDEVAGLVLCDDDINKLGKTINDIKISKKILEKAKEYFPILAISSAVAIIAKDINNKILFPGIIDINVKIEEGAKEIPLDIPVLGQKIFKGIFKKNINISRVAPNIGILCQMENQEIVFIRQGNVLAVTFHPELTDDLRVHQYFLQIIEDNT